MIYDPWSPYATVANDILLEFEAGALTRRWLHGPTVDEPIAYERYTGTTAGGSGTALELFPRKTVAPGGSWPCQAAVRFIFWCSSSISPIFQ